MSSGRKPGGGSAGGSAQVRTTSQMSEAVFWGGWGPSYKHPLLEIKAHMPEETLTVA